MITRVAVALLVVVVALAAYAGWYVYGAWPVPQGYDFPRHSIWGGGPLALFDGTLTLDGSCIRTAIDGATVVWPPGYRLAIVGREPVVFGGSHRLLMGQPVQMGGGFYDNPPPTSFAIGDCPAPYFLSTGFID